MTEEIDAIMLDAGGTLIDLKPSREAIFAKVLHQHGFNAELEDIARSVARAERVFDDAQAKLDGKHEDVFWNSYDEFILKRLGFKGDHEKFSKDVSVEFDRVVPEVKNWVAFPDARPLLEDLKKRDFKIGLVSNATDLARKVMDNLDLSKYFDIMILSEEVGLRKPDPKIFLKAADEVGVHPSRAIHIGDRLAVDVLGAKKAGMNAVLIDRTSIYSDVDCLKIKTLDEMRRFL